MRAAVFGILLAGGLVGCVHFTTSLNLQRESARSIFPTPYPDSVRVSDIQQGLTWAKWVATTPSGVYECSIRQSEARPICAKRETTR